MDDALAPLRNPGTARHSPAPGPMQPIQRVGPEPYRQVPPPALGLTGPEVDRLAPAPPAAARRSVALVPPLRPPPGDAILLGPVAPRAPLQPDRGALHGVGRRDYTELREARRAPREPLVIRAVAQPPWLDGELEEVDAPVGPLPPPDLDGDLGSVVAGDVQIKARWQTGKRLPDDLPPFLPIDLLRDGDDYAVERPPDCKPEPTETWLVHNRKLDRVHPTAQERYHRFIVVGDDLSASLPPHGDELPAFTPSFRPLDEAVVDAMLEIAAPNATVAVRSSDGRLVYSKSFTWVDWYRQWFAHTDLSMLSEGKELGYLQRRDGTLRISVTTPCSGFRWASVTKPMTAMMTLAMCASPDIDIDLSSRVFPNRDGPHGAPWAALYDDMAVLFAETGERPRDYYRRFDAAGGRPITAIQIRHLLTHTAGWSNGHGTDPAGAGTTGVGIGTSAQRSAAMDFRTFPLQPREALRWQFSDDRDTLKTQLLRGSAWPAGEARLYSNVGYALLAQVLTYAGGDTLHRLMERWVFGPCGMHHSRLPDRVTLAERKAGDALFFARASQVEFAATASTWSDGWNSSDLAYSQSQMTLPDGSDSPDWFPGIRPDRWDPYGANSVPMKSGASGLVATAVDVTKFGHAIALNNMGSPLLNLSWRSLVWFGILTGLRWPTRSTQLMQTLGFGRGTSLTGDVYDLHHGGETVGGAAYLYIAGPDAHCSGRDPFDGLTLAFSMNRSRNFTNRLNEQEGYPQRPETTIQRAVRTSRVVGAVEQSTGSLEVT